MGLGFTVAAAVLAVVVVAAIVGYLIDKSEPAEQPKETRLK
jgi:hypothetical protein